MTYTFTDWNYSMLFSKVELLMFYALHTDSPQPRDQQSMCPLASCRTKINCYSPNSHIAILQLQCYKACKDWVRQLSFSSDSVLAPHTVQW